MDSTFTLGFLFAFVIVIIGNFGGYASAQSAGEVASTIKDMIQTKSENHIKAREKTSGFEFLDMWARVSRSKGIRKRHLLKRVNRDLKPFVRNDPRLRDIVDTLLEYIGDDVEEHGEQFFTILSNNGYGGTRALFVYYKQLDNGRFMFKKMMFSGRFKLAATLVITRSKKSGWFSSSSKDVINYLPRRGITAQDVKDLLNIIVPQLNEVMNGFVPESDD